MSLASIQGVIERRILANYRIDPAAVAKLLPAPFRPQLANGWAIGGICLIRLGSMRPSWFPLAWGLRSENAAHRIAVEWDEDGEVRTGVYIPRRHTNSRWNVLAGGAAFPVVQQLARFQVHETADQVSVEVRCTADGTAIHVAGSITPELPAGSIFGDLQSASAFFQRGSLGYSADRTGQRHYGIELACESWAVKPLQIREMRSSFFQDQTVFPAGSVQADCALLMQGIPHVWHNRGLVCCD